MQEEQKNSKKSDVGSFIEQKIKNKVLKKIFLFLMANPIVLVVIGCVIGFLVFFCVFIILISTVFSTVQVPTDMYISKGVTLSEKEKEDNEELATTEVTEKECKEGFFDKFLPGLQSGCELLNYINKQVTKYESNTGYSVDKGLVIASIWYAYAQTSNDDRKNNIDSSNGQNMLGSIVESINSGIFDFKKDDVVKLIENQNLIVEYDYKIYEEEKNSDGTVSHSCKKHEGLKRFDKNIIFNMFMRYGEDTIKDFTSDVKNKYSKEDSSKECGGGDSGISLEKYENFAKYNVSIKDELELDYKNGFMATTFPTTNFKLDDNIKYPKLIEKLLAEIFSHSKDINSMFGYDENLIAINYVSLEMQATSLVNLSRNELVSTLGPIAQAYYTKYPELLASTILTLAISEHGTPATDNLLKKTNNFFSISCGSYEGECYNGWRVYSNIGESFEDLVKLITNPDGRYKDIGNYGTTEQQLEYIYKQGYCVPFESCNSNGLNVLNSHSFKKYDSKVNIPNGMSINDFINSQFITSLDIPSVDVKNGFTLPWGGLDINKFRVTGKYGTDRGDHIHAGTDYGIPSGTPMYSILPGKVIRSSYYGTAGNAVIVYHGEIENGKGLVSYYFHFSKYAVSVGDSVNAGQFIGMSGNTGRSEGPHLHFEVRTFEKGQDVTKHSAGKHFNSDAFLKSMIVKVNS